MANSSKSKIRYAVVGLGNIAQVAVLPAFEHASENSALVALLSSDPKKLSILSERYSVKIMGSYEGLDRILASAEVDAIYVATPSSKHRIAVESAAHARSRAEGQILPLCSARKRQTLER